MYCLSLSPNAYIKVFFFFFPIESMRMTSLLLWLLIAQVKTCSALVLLPSQPRIHSPFNKAVQHKIELGRERIWKRDFGRAPDDSKTEYLTLFLTFSLYSPTLSVPSLITPPRRDHIVLWYPNPTPIVLATQVLYFHNIRHVKMSKSSLHWDSMV